MDKNRQPREGLLEYLDVIWGERGTHEVDLAPGEIDYVCMATIDSNGEFKKAMFTWPDQSDVIVANIFKEVSSFNEVYVYPCTFKEAGRSVKANFKKSHTLWVDFDGNAPTDEWESVSIPKPSMRVISSTPDRQHNYWKLAEPVTDYRELESRNRTLAYELDADIGGWDAVQLLRPPYTTNFGYSKPERKKQHDVRVEELTSVAYSLTDFRVNQTLVSNSPAGLSDKLIDELHLLTGNTWSDQLLDDWGHVPQEGSKLRSDALVSMAHQACELGWTDEMIYALVVHMDKKVGKYKNRTDAERRYTDIVVRVRMKHPVSQEADIPLANDTRMTVKELLVYDKKLNWLLGEVIPENSLGLLVSAPGLGKTTISLKLGMALVGGQEEFLNHEVVPKDYSKVLFFSLEMAEIKIAKFLHSMHLTQTEVDKLGSLIIYPTGRDMLLDTPQGRQVFKDAILREEPTVIIIDSINKILKGSIANDDSVRELTRYLTGICLDHNVSILLLHHDRKRGEQFIGKPTTLDDVYGSRFLTSECDYVVTLNKVEKEPDLLRLNYVKSRFAQEQPPTIIRRVDNLDFKVVDQDAPVLTSSTRKPSPKPDKDTFGGLFG